MMISMIWMMTSPSLMIMMSTFSSLMTILMMVLPLSGWLLLLLADVG